MLTFLTFALGACGGGDPSDELPDDDSPSDPDALGDLSTFLGGGEALTDRGFLLLGGVGVRLGDFALLAGGGDELGLFSRAGDGDRRLLGDMERLPFLGDGDDRLLLQHAHRYY